MKSITLVGILALLTTLASPVRAQVPPVDEPAICYNCHEDIAGLKGKKHLHTAFKSGKCSACHNPHASRHAALLTADPKALCVSCHAGVKAELALPVAHQPAQAGECGSCHDPHASDFAGQLLQNASLLCQGCHAPVKDWLSRPVVHAPVKEGKCLSCHSPHGAANDNLLKKKTAAVCSDCHREDAAFDKAHQGYKVGDANCATCHDPHASSLKGLVRPNQHAPFKSGKCASCHSTSAGQPAFAVQTKIKNLCLGCHSELQPKLQVAYHHNLDDEKSCVNCHNPHTSSSTFLLAADQKVLCMRCHFNEPGRKKKELYITHSGMDCTNCHLPHGADNPRYLKDPGLDLCIGCHARAHQGSHPVGGDLIDVRTGGPLTCLSCHQLHGADFDQYLPLNPAMDLCIQCHKNQGSK